MAVAAPGRGNAQHQESSGAAAVARFGAGGGRGLPATQLPSLALHLPRRVFEPSTFSIKCQLA